MKSLNKKGTYDVKTMMVTFIMGIIALVLILKLGAALLPQAMDAGDELNASGIELGSFFASGGILWTIVSIGIFIGLLYLAFGFFKSKK